MYEIGKTYTFLPTEGAYCSDPIEVGEGLKALVLHREEPDFCERLLLIAVPDGNYKSRRTKWLYPNCNKDGPREMCASTLGEEFNWEMQTTVTELTVIGEIFFPRRR